ncbi:MAG: hypothetical protein ACJAZO_003479 [Myxococcota bacterium]
MYRIGYAESSASADCFGEFGEDPNLALDETNILSPAAFAVYRVADVYYLDFGNRAISGTKDGNEFRFNGEDLNIDFFGGSSENRLEDRDELTITFTVNGASIIGREVIETSTTCTGADCDPSQTLSCTETSNFFGSEVKDVDLNWGLDNNGF